MLKNCFELNFLWGDFVIYNYDGLNFKVLSMEKYEGNKNDVEVQGRIFDALAFRTEGEGCFEIDGKSFVSRKGDVIFIPKNVPYKVSYKNCSVIAIHFSECNYENIENITVSNPGKIYSIFEKIDVAFENGESVNKIKSLVYGLLDEIGKSVENSVSDTEFLKFVRYIDENFTNAELDIESMCVLAYISKSTLQRKFNRYYGISPKQYILKLRTEKALGLLLANELSIKEIAVASGFKDEKYFSRVIKERYGIPPSEISKRFAV